MILAAQDIQAKQFHVRFRGFDVEEVDDFLEKAAASFQALHEENQKLHIRLETLEQELSHYQNQQKTFQNAIVAAQNVADGMKEKSRQEAEAIVAAAHEEARQRREAADREIDGLNGKILRLKGLREETRDELRRQLHAYLAVLEADRQDAAEPGSHQAEPIIITASSQAATTGSKSSGLAGPAPREARLESDLDDLYVKIDIPDIDQSEFNQEEAETDLPELSISLPGEEEHLQDQALPDLDSELVFNLDDPLEENEPEISFSETLEEVRQNPPGRFNPDKSPL